MSGMKESLQGVAILVLCVVFFAFAFWVQDRMWQALGVDMPWWGYVLFWGPIAGIALVVKAREKSRDAGHD